MESVFNDDEFVDIPIEDQIFKIRKSNRPTRFEDETRDEYKIRMKIMNEYLKHYKRGKFIHISSFLTPLVTNDGTVLTDIKGKIIYNGKSKGVTYVKNQMLQEHTETMKQIKKIIEHGTENK